MSGDIFDCCNGCVGWGGDRRPAGRGQGCCSTSCKAQDSCPPPRITQPKVLIEQSLKTGALNGSKEHFTYDLSNLSLKHLSSWPSRSSWSKQAWLTSTHIMYATVKSSHMDGNKASKGDGFLRARRRRSSWRMWKLVLKAKGWERQKRERKQTSCWERGKILNREVQTHSTLNICLAYPLLATVLDTKTATTLVGIFQQPRKSYSCTPFETMWISRNFNCSRGVT